ncbi:MAG: NmrA/HSCARG family protein [Sedimentisphaerales bacterium]|nr:NmrA/HSCARG family protein [Sedimentisphaerales bacterium]
MATNGKILVTGATGQQGGAVARELLARGHKIRAMTRNPEKERARALTKLGAEIIRGDLDDPASLKKVTQGVWGVFAVQNTWEAGVEKEEQQGKRLAEIAKKAGVQHYLYSSVGSAHRNTGIPHFDNKWRVEETVRALDFPSHTIIRPVFFMENFISPWFKPSIDEGKLAVGIRPDTVLQMIAVEDIGKFVTWAFNKHEELNGRAIDIAGDARTMPETAEIFSSALGRKIEFVRTPIEQVRQFSEDFAIMLEWFDAVGYNADIEAITEESGIRPLTLTEWAIKVYKTLETAKS